MERSIAAPKADNKVYRFLSERFSGYEVVLVAGVGVFVFGTPTVIIIATVSIWFLFLMTPVILWIVAGIAWAVNSKPMDVYSYARTLYQNAYYEYQRIRNPDDRADAKTLLDNVWAHEVAFAKLNKNHDDRHCCKPCWERGVLISRIREGQTLPGTDTSDIEAFKMKQQIKKELEL